MIGIYCIKNQKTNWNYIGSSVSIFNRWKQHSKELNEGKHHCHRLQCAWDSDGATNFTFSILEICGEEILLQKEQEWIDRLYNDGCIYNTKVKVVCEGDVALNKPKAIIRKRVDRKKDKLDGLRIPKNININGVTLRTGRMLLYSFNKAITEKTNYIEISVGEYMKCLGIASRRIYGECEQIYKDELLSIISSGLNIIDECEYENGILTINFNEEIITHNGEVYVTKIKPLDLKRISSLKFIDFLFLMMNNNNILKITVEEFKTVLGYTGQYEHYANLKQQIINVIQKDFEKVGYSLSVKENKIGRCVHSIEFELK